MRQVAEFIRWKYFHLLHINGISTNGTYNLLQVNVFVFFFCSRKQDKVSGAYLRSNENICAWKAKQIQWSCVLRIKQLFGFCFSMKMLLVLPISLNLPIKRLQRVMFNVLLEHGNGLCFKISTKIWLKIASEWNKSNAHLH